MIKKEILLSIIIPVYNVSQYLSATLNNVLSQTFTDFELILVDDGSIDGSAEICDKYAQNDSRIIVIHQKNAGVSVARNIGVKKAQGEYIGFVDSDDLIEPNMFETLIDVLEKENADIVQCRHNRDPSIKNVIICGEKRELDGKKFIQELFDYNGMEYTNQVSLWSKLYKRRLFDGIEFPMGRTYEDEQETYKICLKANKIIQIPDELYHYVKRENSIITGTSAKKMLDKQYALIDRYTYLSKRIPSLEGKSMTSLYNYSVHIICELYKNNDIVSYKLARDNILHYRKEFRHFINKYDRIYWIMMKFPLLEKWIMCNDFEPIQRILSNMK